MKRLMAALLLVSGMALGERVLTVELLSEREPFAPGETNWLAVVLRLAKGWHTYWINPGDAGMPPRLRWHAPAGFEIGEPRFPTPARFVSDGMVSFGYEDEAILLVPLVAPADLANESHVIELQVDALVCRDVCIPQRATAKLVTPSDGNIPPERIREAFAKARARLPMPDPPPDVRAALRGREVLMRLPKPARAVFYPAGRDVFTLNTAGVEQRGDVVRLRLSPLAANAPDRIRGVLVMDSEAYEIDLVLERSER